jgi:hypothetical protein
MTSMNPTAGAVPHDEATSEGDKSTEEDAPVADGPKNRPVGADQAKENRENDPPS